MLFNYHLFYFTDYVHDPQVKYTFGISAISLVSIEILWVTIAWAKDKVIDTIWKVKKHLIYEPKMKRFLERKRQVERAK